MKGESEKSPEPLEVDCFDCDGKAEVAYYDDIAMSSIYINLCYDCRRDAPEFNLFVQDEETMDKMEEISMAEIPRLESEKDYRIVDNGAEEEEYKWEIVVREKDRDLVEEAREELRDIRDD